MMATFFAGFLDKYKASAEQCAVMLHSVPAIDELIMRSDREAARIYASFHELPLTQNHRIREGTRYVFSFLSTRDRCYVLNDIYEVKEPFGPRMPMDDIAQKRLDLTDVATREYQAQFPHNALPVDRNFVGYCLEHLPEGEKYRDRLVVRKPESFARGYVFYAQNPACCEMLSAADVVDARPEAGPMDLVVQVPLDLLATLLSRGQLRHADFSKPGVYLLRHTKSGDTYVGGAYGTRGLMGRWRDYADTVHGGNVELTALVGNGAKADDFTVTALEVCENKVYARSAESMWKRRLLPTLNRN